MISKRDAVCFHKYRGSRPISLRRQFVENPRSGRCIRCSKLDKHWIGNIGIDHRERECDSVSPSGKDVGPDTASILTKPFRKACAAKCCSKSGRANLRKPCSSTTNLVPVNAQTSASFPIAADRIDRSELRTWQTRRANLVQTSTLAWFGRSLRSTSLAMPERRSTRRRRRRSTRVNPLGHC